MILDLVVRRGIKEAKKKSDYLNFSKQSLAYA